jgi:rhamnosyltransferase subunit B
MQASGTDSRRHFVVIAIGSAGDLYPFLSLALALQQRGHPVTFVGPALHEQQVRQAGLAFQAAGSREQYFAAIDDPDLWHPRKAFGVVWRAIEGGLGFISEFVATLPREEGLVLVAHPLALPAAALARADRPEIKIVAVYLAPSNLRTCHDPLTMGPLRIPGWLPMRLRQWLWRLIDVRLLDPLSLPGLNAARQSKGLGPVAHLADSLYGTADRSVTLFPSWFGKQQPDWPEPMHNGDFQLYEPDPNQVFSRELVEFLAAGDLPVVFTPGTGHRHASVYFAHALEVVQRLERRAIFLTSHRAQVPEQLPPSVFWLSYAPFKTLLPKVAALVHHGGIGTTAEALRAGVPQLVVPLAHDQFDNAMQVQSLGAGVSLPAYRLSTRALYKALGNLLESNTIRTRSREVAARFTKNGDSEALCHFIESV